MSGLTINEAKELMKKYLSADLPSYPGTYYGTYGGSPNAHSNCTLFSQWFLKNYTNDDISLAQPSGFGKEMVQFLVNTNKNKLSVSNSPTAFSVFSISGNNGYYYTGDAGHTGIVLGIQGNTIITGEANYGAPYGGLDAVYPNHGVVVRTYSANVFNSTTGVTFVDLNKYIVDGLKNKKGEEKKMVNVINHIVVPGNPAQDYGLTVAPWNGIHLHSTGNPTSTMQNERDYLARNYMNANYTHLVGWNHETGRAEAWQVMAKGGAFDVGGSANWDGWASIEFVEGSIKTQAQFDAAYRVYLELSRQLLDELSGDYQVDDGSYTGIETHDYISKTGRGSDHTDPLGFLSKWGISYAQLKKDMVSKKWEASQPSKPNHPIPSRNGMNKLVVARYASQWSKSSSYKPIKSFVKGATYDILKERPIEQSRSKKEYLIGKNGMPTGWLLEQDVERFV